METSLASSFPLMSSLDELESILDKFSQKNEQQQQHHQQHHQQQQQQPLQQHSVYASNNFSDKINEWEFNNNVSNSNVINFSSL